MRVGGRPGATPAAPGSETTATRHLSGTIGGPWAAALHSRVEYHAPYAHPRPFGVLNHTLDLGALRSVAECQSTVGWGPSHPLGGWGTDFSLPVRKAFPFTAYPPQLRLAVADHVPGPPGRMTSAAARSLPELLVHSPGVREGIPLLGGSIARRSEQPLSSRGLRRHPRAHARRWHARAARRREATHSSLSVAAATVQPARPASNFGLGCPLNESGPTTSPGTGSR